MTVQLVICLWCSGIRLPASWTVASAHLVQKCTNLHLLSQLQRKVRSSQALALFRFFSSRSSRSSPRIRCTCARQEEHAHCRALADKEAFLNDQIDSNKVVAVCPRFRIVVMTSRYPPLCLGFASLLTTFGCTISGRDPEVQGACEATAEQCTAPPAKP